MNTRGVWVAPWTGPGGEKVLLAVDGFGRLAGGPVTIPLGVDPVAIADRLWDLIDCLEQPIEPPDAAPHIPFRKAPASERNVARSTLRLLDGNG